MHHDTQPLIIRPRAEDVEGQPILRPLPSAKCRSVGPFVFFDHMLETDYPPGKGMNIRQHPHIGLSTLTYLFEGQIQHKDSLGSDQVVSRRCQLDDRRQCDCPRRAHARSVVGQSFTMHGCRSGWLRPRNTSKARALQPSPGRNLPVSDNLGVQIRMIAGSGFCLESPVPVLSPTLYADVRMQTATTLLIPTEHEERGGVCAEW
jgi:redox-sensitive bicupin YhaK (pirin superfamily)